MTKEEKTSVVSKVKFELLEKYSAGGLDDEVINDCIEATIKALSMHVVIQQRELLIALAEFVTDGDLYETKKDAEHDVDLFIRNLLTKIN